MDYLNQDSVLAVVFMAVAFFLGAFITNMFRSKKISALQQEAQDCQSRFYELQNASKKQLSEKAELIKKLKVEKSNHARALFRDSQAEDAPIIKTLQSKNTSLENELRTIKAENKELKVERAVKKVDKKHPMQLYAMDSKSSEVDPQKRTAKKDGKATAKKKKSKKLDKLEIAPTVDKKKSSAVKSKDSNTKVKEKSKKSKKKSKSKKRKPKKVLALIETGKKSKKSKKKKKKKAK